MSNPNLGPGPGRPPGSKNKATLKARRAIAEFVDDNAWRLQIWLDQIAQGVYEYDENGNIKKVLKMPDPQTAFSLFQSVIEYHIPKLSRTEQQYLDKDGEPADASVTVKYI